MYLLQQIVSGLSVGSLYAFFALGLVIIYKTTDIANFAQGEIALFTTFIGFTILNQYQIPYLASIIIVLLISLFLGAVIERIAIRPLLGSPIMSIVIFTLGLMMALNSLAGLIWGHDTYRFPALFDEEPIVIGGLIVSKMHIGTIAITIILTSLIFGFLKFNIRGIAMRAIPQNKTSAYLSGIHVERYYSGTWAVGSVLGALAGILFAPLVNLGTTTMEPFLMKGFASAVLGGISNLGGALVGGLILGVSENIVGGYLDPRLKETVGFVLILLILLVKPQGLFGKHYQRKV